MPYPTYLSGRPDLVQNVEAARVEYAAAMVDVLRTQEAVRMADKAYEAANDRSAFYLARLAEKKQPDSTILYESSVDRVEALLMLKRATRFHEEATQRMAEIISRLDTAIDALV